MDQLNRRLTPQQQAPLFGTINAVGTHLRQQGALCSTELSLSFKTRGSIRFIRLLNRYWIGRECIAMHWLIDICDFLLWWNIVLFFIMDIMCNSLWCLTGSLVDYLKTPAGGSLAMNTLIDMSAQAGFFSFFLLSSSVLSSVYMWHIFSYFQFSLLTKRKLLYIIL